MDASSASGARKPRPAGGPPVLWRESRDCWGRRRFASSACGEVAPLPIGWSASPRASCPALLPVAQPPMAAARGVEEAKETVGARGTVGPSPAGAGLVVRAPAVVGAPTSSVPSIRRALVGRVPSILRTLRVLGVLSPRRVLLARPIPLARRVRGSLRATPVRGADWSIRAAPVVSPSRIRPPRWTASRSRNVPPARLRKAPAT